MNGRTFLRYSGLLVLSLVALTTFLSFVTQQATEPRMSTLINNFHEQAYVSKKSNTEAKRVKPNILEVTNGTKPTKTSAIIKSAPATTEVSGKTLKIVFGATDLWHNVKWADIFNFKNCKYQNCICSESSKFVGIEHADLVIFGRNEFTHDFPNVPWQIRQKQYWFMMTDESGWFPSHTWGERFNNRFNGTMMYRRDATIYNPYGKTENLPMIINNTRRNFASGKPKGAFAYVSNCYNGNYNRLGVMEELAKYIPVDIFSSACEGDHVKPPPCPRGVAGSNVGCENEKHREYRFFLSFENTLCLDYITEKFWDRLKSTSFFLPIAMGGLSIDDYTKVSPPNSFLHVYNFTSIQKLGEHLRYLMNNDDSYNQYHEWRYKYSINTDRNIPACQVCELLHQQPDLPVVPKLADWRNNRTLCRNYDLKSQQTSAQ